MSGNVTDDPLARSVLRHFAENRGKDDPLGSLARTVLSGQAGLRTAAEHPWHSQALADAARTAQHEQAAMPAEQRDAIEQAAAQIRTRLQDDGDPAADA